MKRESYAPENLPDRFSATNPAGQYWHCAQPKDKYDPNGAEVANALIRVATERENAAMPRRWSHYVFARSMSGRPNIATFAYGMAKRPSTFLNYYNSFQFSAQKAGLSSLLGDVYVNRLLSHKTYIDQVPDQGDLYSQRRQAKMLERWGDAAFDETGYWDCWKRAGVDALWYGTGVVWFNEDDGDKKILPETVHMDEILFGNEEIPFKDQKEVVRRQYVDRYELWSKHKDNPEAADAILAAPSAHSCYYFGPGNLNTDNVVALVTGIKLSCLDDGKGRITTAIANYALSDEEYTPDQLPCEAFSFSELSGNTWGQGLAEQTLQFSEWLDMLLDTANESNIRAGRGKWFVDETSEVNLDDLSDAVANVVTFLNKRPEYEAHDPISQQLLLMADKLIEFAMTRVHVSLTAVKGELPKQLSAAVAIEKFAQIEDSNFNELLNRVEEFTRRSMLQYIRIAKRLAPKYTYSGRTKQLIDWPKLEMNDGQTLNIKAYCSGRFGQTMAGKIQKMQELRQQGDISRQQYLRYLEIPSTGSMFDVINARVDLVDEILEDLIFQDDFIPVPAFCDLDYAIGAAEDRYSMERQQETPDDVLDRIMQFRAMAIELKTQGQPKEENNLALPPVAPGAAPGAAPGSPGGIGAAPGLDPGAPPMPPVDVGSGMPTQSLNPQATPNGLPAPPIDIPAAM